MRVHIVCEAPADDRQRGSVLYRLASVLAEQLQWSIADEPDAKADLNYFFPYVTWAQRFRGWHETPVAAYFSHRDTQRQRKLSWWKSAALEVDMRVVTARRYLDEMLAFGPAAHARPPLDRDRFDIATRIPQLAKPTIGVSGFVYGDGRKGEDLVQELAAGLDGRAKMVATGAGWPVPGGTIPYDDLPAFYQSLDLFVCASRIEGVPMTILEALACGVPCVVPEGVGIVDELPTMDGLYRFQPGDAESLLYAVNDALFRLQRFPVGRQALRSATEAYNPTTWADDHLRAFEGLLYNAPVVIDESPGTGHAGLYMVAFGRPSRDCASLAITSFKRQMPGIPVALVSTEPLGPEDIFIRQPETDIGGRSAKTRIDSLAPADWEYILYLDADTETVADISFLYSLLTDGWEFVICKNPGKYHTTRRMVRPDNVDECEETYNLMGTDEALQFNGGVFAYRRNARTRRFFRDWHYEWNRFCGRDQAALLRALWANPLRIYTLGNAWNTVDRYCDITETAGIIHRPMTARRWSGIIPGRTDSPEAWEQVKQ